MWQERDRMIVFRVDSSPEIGAGHWMRCLTLARACERATFVSQEWLEPLKREAEHHGVEVRTDWPESRPDWVVMDGYRYTLEDQKAVQAPLLLVDDNREHAKIVARAVLNPNVHASEALYMDVQAELLVGPRYFLLRPEYRDLKRRAPADTVRTVLVTLGGSSQPQTLERIVGTLNGLPQKLEVLLLGPEVPVASHHALRWLGFRSDLPALLGEADLVVTASGTTVLEALYAGIPTLALCLATNQLGIYRHLIEREHVLPFDADSLSLALTDVKLRRRMSERGVGLIDGQGAPRVAAFLKGSDPNSSPVPAQP